MSKYKDVGEVYTYQIQLLNEGYNLYCPFLYSDYPKDFLFPHPYNGWSMRNAIKKWINENSKFFENFDWQIVRANGYWRDLHGDYVYEVWIRKKVGGKK